MFHDLIARVRSLLGGRSADRDLDAELADHLDHQIRWRVEQGMTREEAVRQARLDLGGLEPLKEQCRDERGTRWLEDAWRDVVYAVRLLRRTPAFALTAIASLALGIGANTVVFGLLNGLVLRPPPIHDPDRVLFVGGTRFAAQSYPNYLDFRDRNVTFASLAGFRLAPMGLRHDTATDQAWGYLVTGNYFETLGVQPWLGRLLAPTDDTAPGANPVLVLGFAYWRSHFAGDPAVVGQTVAINTRAYTIVGVAPRDFGGTERFFQPDVWVPISMQPQIEQFAWTTSRRASNLDVIGRLADGVTPVQAEANLNAIAADLARRYPDDDAGLAVRVSRPGWLGDQLGAPVAAFARALMALVLLVLFAACANLAGLVAARAADRRRELAVRVAIGAGRGRILRQLTVEALVLATAGGIVGAGVATALLGALSRWRAVAEIPIHFDVAVDVHVLLFAALATVVSGLLVGVAPARIAWRTDLASAWKGTSAAPAVRWRRWITRDLLVAVQVAISCALVFAASVAGRELVREISAPVGFQPDNADVVAFDLGLAGYDAERGRAFHQRALESMRALPGVTSAAYADSLPLSINQSNSTVFPDHGTDFRADQAIVSSRYAVSPGYFATVGTRLLRGRDFTDADAPGTPPIAIVNRAFARQVLHVDDPVGERFRYGRDGQPIEIVGLVEDGKYVTMIEDSHPALFVPERQQYSANTLLIVRHAPGRASMAAELHRLVTRLDPNVPIYAAGAVTDLIGFAFLPARVATIALGAFGLMAVMLALTGTYGVASYAVSRREKEIGIRVAIGAHATHVIRAMLDRVIALVLSGIAAGLGLAWLASRLVGSIVHGGAAADAMTIASTVVAMLVIGVVAAWTPARRALAVDPVTALRAD